MKNQTFGVEIEMNHITRKNAARLAAQYFGTEDTVQYDGTVYQIWSCKDTKGRKWQFERDSSIAGPDDQKCEMVTPILKYEDMEMLQELVRRLRKAGAVSNPKQGCGVHIHIGINGTDGNNHTPQTLRNLANIMAAHESILISALKLDWGRMSSYCKPVDGRFLADINKKKPKTMADLADVWYQSQGCNYGRNQHYNSSRYHMLNLHATFTKGTIEFRLFQFDNPGTNLQGKAYRGGLHAGQLKSYIQLCLALSQKAKEVKTASPKALITDNPKYAMRCWLLRLGFIGEEFKTARDILTRNLKGNAAWRHGAPTAIAV